MTQAINTSASGQVIPFKDAERTEQPKAGKERSAADVGASILQSESVVSADNTAETQDPLQRVAAMLQEIMPEENLRNTRLRIDKDDNTGDYVYQTLDNDTGEVIRQFPPETIMEMLSKIRDVEGVAIDKLA